ncbi:MAG: AbrB/MazE/SpoVT family DNA-binding domain-containing protein [Cyanobacteria bacterium REEB65]|nr:AbrB/MazE/SpoVT family DNA-binding domain-containing protein [Cyanobacteria bacterium REEB65]
MRITSKGQVTIPSRIREQAGLLPHTEVGFEFDGQTVRIFSIAPSRGESRGQALVRRLRGSGRGKMTMTTDEIMALTRGDE